MGESFYLTLCVALVVVLIICIIILVRIYTRLMSRNETLRESIENLSRLNDRLRMDRHDYLNHLQIVYGLMELGEYDEMDQYLRKFYRELQNNAR